MFHVDKAVLVPAQCAFTKSHVGPFVDFGRDFDFDHVGRIYIKESYARELGVFCGLPSIEERDDLVRQVQEANAALAALRELVVRQKGRVEELEEFRRQALEVKADVPDKPAAKTPAAKKAPAKKEKT